MSFPKQNIGLFLLTSVLMMVLCCCTATRYGFKVNRECVGSSSKSYPDDQAARKHGVIYAGSPGGYFPLASNSPYTTEEYRLLKERFQLSVREVANGYKEFYYRDTLVTRMFASSPRFSRSNSRMIIQGSDTAAQRMTLYADRSKYKLWLDRNAYEFWGDTLIYIDKTLLMGWGPVWNAKAPSIYRFNADLSASDTLFTLPGSEGYLANPVSVTLDVINDKWIWEWSHHVFVNTEDISMKYDTLSPVHYTFLNGKEFFFYQDGGYEQGYDIHYNEKPIGRLGYTWIKPLYSEKTEAVFLGRKGKRFYKVTLTGK